MVTLSVARPPESPDLGPVSVVDSSSPPGARSRGWLIGLALAVLVGAGLLGWRLLPRRAAPAARVQAVSVGVAKVVAGDMHVDLRGLGTVTPTATVTVQTQINGQLMSVGFHEGQLVQKGQFLAQIDPRPFQAALEQAQGALAHDTGLLKEAQTDLTRFQTLLKQDSIARQMPEDQEYLVEQDQGSVQQDNANIETAKLNLAYCRILSPVAGRVGLRLVDPGNYVQTASATGLVVVTQLQPITVIFVLPEDDIPSIVEQMRASGGQLPVAAYDRTNDKLIAQGTLTTLDNTVDTTTGTVKLRATFPNDDLSLFPNEFVNARLMLKTLSRVTEVPVRAIQYGAPGAFVYVVKPNNTVAVQVIKTGATDGDRTQVLSGLSPGDTVVVDGVSLLRAGSKVRIAKASSVAADATNAGPGAPPGEQPQNARRGRGQAQPQPSDRQS